MQQQSHCRTNLENVESVFGRVVVFKYYWLGLACLLLARRMLCYFVVYSVSLFDSVLSSTLYRSASCAAVSDDDDDDEGGGSKCCRLPFYLDPGMRN